MNAITDFINYELYPALYDRLDSAFPELEFRLKGGDWHSSHYLNGEPTSPYREDKTVVTKKKPHLIHEQGGETLSLVDYQLKRSGHAPGAKGAELIEALRSLAGICGLELPDNDTEEYKAYQIRQEALEKLARKMKAELFERDGADTLFYLTEERGYSLEEVKAMELGYCSQETASQLEGAPYGAGTQYTLAIPYRSGGRILGFKLRTIEPDVKPKYKNTSGLPKKASLFGLTGLRLTGNGEKDRDLTVVEGELDALRAQVRGVENIVASAGLDLSDDALQEAKKRGVKRVTLLVDSEETPAKQYAKEEAISKAIHTVHRAGLVSLVSVLPGGQDGTKVDTDSYLTYHSKEELQKVIDSASTGAKYLFDVIYGRAVASQGEEDTISDKLYDNYKEETLALLNDVEVVSPVDRDRILTLFARSTGGAGITKEALQEEADRRKQLADAERQAKRTRELLEKASNLAQEGRIGETLQLLQEGASTVSQIAKDTELSSLLALPTADGIREKLRTRPKGIETDYYFSSGKQAERLVLPAGALTLVCAPPGHGKSTFLRNFALQTAESDAPGTVLYFTYEEDYESTVMELVNTYAGLELTSPSRHFGNLTTIADYYRNGTTQYIKHEVEDSFKEKEARFMKEIIEAGKLRIYDSDFYSDELVDAIRFVSRKLRVKAVFIDYVQLLYKQGGSKLQRNEELKAIAKSLRELAKEAKLPIVLSAQLNREAKSPTEMFSQNIADSADLEREANKVILLWNSVERKLNGSQYNEKSIEESKRMELGTPGKIYALLSKNRGGAPKLDATFIFNGNTGQILPNGAPAVEDLPADEEEEDGELPF